MGVMKEENRVVFEGVVYEDEIVALREYLQECSPAVVTFDFSGSDDLHLGVLQVILAYQKLYGAEYRFADQVKLYQRVCEGFERGNEHCA